MHQGLLAKLLYASGMTGINGEALSYADMCRIFENAYKDVKADLEARGRGDELVGARIIYCALRFISIDEMKKSVDSCIQLKQEFPHLLAGRFSFSSEIQYSLISAFRNRA